MISTQAAPDALPELPPSNGADDDPSGTLVAFRDSRGRLGGRAGAAPGVRVLVAGGHALVRAGFRSLLEAGGRISVVGEECDAGRSSPLAPDPRKSSEVLGVDTERHSGAGLHTQGLHHCVARRPENLNLGRRVERLGVCVRGSLADDAHVELHRRRVRMDLHYRHLGALRIDVLVEGEQPRLASLDEINEPRDAAAFPLVGTWL
jgi:hypothetical protein